MIDSNTQDIDGNRPSAVFTYDDGTNTTDVEVYLNLILSGTDYILDAVDEDNMSIGCHSAVGDVACTVLTISDNITANAGNYVETSIYRSGYSLDICGSDGCWMTGSFSASQRFASIISGIEILTGAYEVIGNAFWEYDTNGDPHMYICNNPSLISKNTTEMSERFIDTGAVSHTATSTAWNYVRNIDYDLNNGGLRMDTGVATSTTGFCDGCYIIYNQKSGKYEVLVFGNLNSGANGGPFCAYAGSALSNATWSIASRPSLGGSLC